MSFIDRVIGRTRKTNFKSGGCLSDVLPVSAPILRTPDKFVAPRKLDFRDMCIQTSNQGDTNHCVGYSVAGYIEIQNWKKNHYPEQVDGDNIYKEAKKIDGYDGEGTWLRFGVQGAINSGLISGKYEHLKNNRDQVRFAIHEYSACILAFQITDEWNSVGKNGEIPIFSNPITRGGHAVLGCGYCPEGLYIQNSWGIRWGLYGFALLKWNLFDKQFSNGIIIRNA